jgi:acyl-CoA thioesterase FadM
MIFRTIYWYLRSRYFSTALGPHDVGRIRMRAQLTDIDTLRHINNGMYLSLMDIGRVDLIIRAGMWRELQKRGWYPVVGSATMTYRRSVQFLTKFTLETRIVGYDERAVYIQQRFVVDGDIFAEGLVKGRFLSRRGGAVSMAELAEVFGVDLSERELPVWVARWSDDVRLPSTRTPAPSDWA